MADTRSARRNVLCGMLRPSPGAGASAKQRRPIAKTCSQDRSLMRESSKELACSLRNDEESLTMATIAFLGAGSVVFTRELLADILSFDELRGATLALHDIDAER